MGKKNAKKNNAAKLCGKDGFEEYYASIFGDRWQALKEALAGESVYACWNGGGTEPYYLDPASVFAALQLPLEVQNIFWICAPHQVEKPLCLLPECRKTLNLSVTNVRLQEKTDLHRLSRTVFLEESAAA